MTRLILFSGTQSPLAVRYARPASSSLILPDLVHRSLHSALDSDEPSALYRGTSDGANTSSAGSAPTLTIPNPSALMRHTKACAPDDDVTVKIQLVRRTSPAEYVRHVSDALAVLAEDKGLRCVDIALVGLPEGTDDSTWLQVWQSLHAVHIPTCTVAKWGTLAAPERLLRLLADSGAVPAANELNVTDYTSVAKEYMAFARERNIDLWASDGNAVPDPLPAPELHNLLMEFKPVLTRVLPSYDGGKLGSIIPVAKAGDAFDASVTPGVVVDWSITYTVFSRTRNVLKDKGYVVQAELL